MSKETGTKLHRTNVRKIMQKYGLSPERSQNVHTNRATKAAVKSWQYRLKNRILRLEKGGFVIAMEDKAFFIHDVKSGRPQVLVPCGSTNNCAIYRKSQKNCRIQFNYDGWQTVLQDRQLV